jgi:hypothetical protein
MTRLHQIPPAQIRRLWADQSLTGIEVAQAIGMTRRGLGHRVKTMGLPDRPLGARLKIDSPVFDEMWRGGVRTQEIADHFNVSRRTVDNAVKRRGLEVRPKAWGCLISAAEYLYAKRLSDAAKITAFAMRDAEMIDVQGGNPSGKARVVA